MRGAGYIAGLAATVAVGACSLDWDALDPRRGDASGGGGGSAPGTGTTTGSAGSGGASSASTAASTGQGGSGGSTTGHGGGPLTIQMECARFCEVYADCFGTGSAGGFPFECRLECQLYITSCPPIPDGSFLACIQAFQACDDVPAFQSCLSQLPCP